MPFLKALTSKMMVKTLLEIAEVLNIKLDDFDIQRALRRGTKRRSPNSKPRLIIAKFMFYKSEMNLSTQKQILKLQQNSKKLLLLKI